MSENFINISEIRGKQNQAPWDQNLQQKCSRNIESNFCRISVPSELFFHMIEGWIESIKSNQLHRKQISEGNWFLGSFYDSINFNEMESSWYASA